MKIQNEELLDEPIILKINNPDTIISYSDKDGGLSQITLCCGDYGIKIIPKEVIIDKV